MALLGGCAPKATSGREKKDKASDVDYAKIPPIAQAMLPGISEHAKALADLGPRQTGQAGCAKALAYVRSALVEAGVQPGDIHEFASTVTVALDRTEPTQLTRATEPFTHLAVETPGQTPEALLAYAMAPNCVQACRTHPPETCPARNGDKPKSMCPNCERSRVLVDLADGEWDDFKGKDLSDTVVLLDFNSDQSWLRAASFGAAGAVFVEPQRTTVFQADKKYLATVPLHFPRVYVPQAEGAKLRDLLAKHPGQVRVTIKNRLRLTNVPAKGFALTIPGRDRSYAIVFAAHVDARSIVPDLAYGGSEVWGIAELIELTRYYLENQPNCDVEVMFVSGHWQMQQPMRDLLAWDGERFGKIGTYYRIAMGIDLVPDGRSINLIAEQAWDFAPPSAYQWLGGRLFNRGGWRDRMLEGLGLKEQKIEFFGDGRPIMSETADGNLAGRNDRSPLVFAPRYPTAEGAWQALGMTSLAFQTSRLARLHHNTPLDTFKDLPAETVAHQLAPQLQIMMATLQHMMQYPPELMPQGKARKRRGQDWGLYTQLTGRVMQWDRSIGWFNERLPAEDDGTKLQTFLHAYPTHEGYTKLAGTRLRNYLQWPLAPARGQHREMQSFMFQDLRLLETPTYRVNTVYARDPNFRYDVVAYSIDAAGRIRFATDYGVHGDGAKAFQCTDREIDSWNLYVPVSLFECGSLELFDLVDPQRYDPNKTVRGTFFQGYGLGGDADAGTPTDLKITGVKDVDSHTDIERWGYTQYGPTAMVFLPANFYAGAEVILGSWFTNFAVLNDPDGFGKAKGYKVGPGDAIRLVKPGKPTPLLCIEQLAHLNKQRLKRFAAHDVASPLAKQYNAQSVAAVAAGDKARQAGDWEAARANYLRGWIFQSLAYRYTVKLLVDVVSTTVLYFVLLIPFSFLLERLVFPQRTVARTALVGVGVFAVFAAVLYLFHPGFKLAANVVVTTTAFVIVVMTIPALILLLFRGVAMLRAIGSKAVITQQSEAESAGVVMAALSLAVSNMRRRRLRTALTLFTITTLVVALVLLTTSSAFDFKILEPSGTEAASFEGLQIYNARDWRQPLQKEMVEVYETVLRDEATVIRREAINYGYDHKTNNGTLYLRANGRRTRVPYFQVMDHRDNDITYTLTKAKTAKQVRLSDLMKAGSFLAADDVDVCILPNNMAEELGVSVGQTVTVMGLPLKVKGIFHAQTKKEFPSRKVPVIANQDRLTRLAAPAAVAIYIIVSGLIVVAVNLSLQRAPRRVRRGGVLLAMAAIVALFVLAHPGFVEIDTGRLREEAGKTQFIPGDLDRLTDLNGMRITCYRGSMQRQGESDNPMHAPSSEVVIVPRKWLHRYGVLPSYVWSLIVVPKGSDAEPERIGRMSERLAKEILNVDIFSHYVDADGKRVANRISMHAATHVKGSSMMLVVLGVAVLMILAIMTGTVYERMREIHIFSSVGLSPRHVAGMFLIEALVYAGIAAVLGYFIGIIALKGLLAYLKASGSTQEFYPNYLGVFVVYSIGMAVLATVASSLYPIRLASKIVNPSDARTWQLGATGDDDSWDIRLPFIATTWDEARAMMVYAYDYLAIHQGERSGQFVCERPPAGRIDGQDIRLASPIWLAPFERNLSQDTELKAAPAADAAWWELSLSLRRLSGPPYLWQRGATVFVNMLCKHMLRWRAASTDQEADCVRRSGEIYPGQ